MFPHRLAAALAVSLLVPAPGRPAEPLSPDERRALEAIRPDSLRGHVAFLASDRLGGRPTPSAEGDLAAEYIAAQFMRAGLAPAGDDGYFQTLQGSRATLHEEGYAFTVSGRSGEVEVAPAAFRMTKPHALALEGVPLLRVAVGGAAPDLPSGSTVLLDTSAVPRGDPFSAFQAVRTAVASLAAVRPAVVIVPMNVPGAAHIGRATLVEPPFFLEPTWPVVGIADPAAAAAVTRHAEAGARLTLRLSEPEREAFTMRNVAGLLRGRDPSLLDSYVLVTAHYDGTGPRGQEEGTDRIWNAANDDASGTAVVMDVAAALARSPAPPSRSVLFVAFAAEETGLRGSMAYARDPLVPLEKTVAALNLEQLGRTDGSGGEKRAWASVTGWEFSTLPPVVARAGPLFGIRVEGDGKRTDPFFARSDNWPLADAGVVAHTVSVLFDDFAEAHTPGDEWGKLDYDNMAALARTVGASVLFLARGEAPRWREDVAAARPYREAAQRRRP